MATLGNIARQRKNSRHHGRRFYTDVDMAFIKHDAAVKNSRVNRGEIKLTSGNEYVQVCGCGVEGCFIHGTT